MAYSNPSHRRHTEPILSAQRSAMSFIAPSFTGHSHEVRPAPFPTVLVPLDCEIAAEHALPYALAVARQSGACIRLVHAYSSLDDIEPWQMYYARETFHRRLREKRQYLLDVARRIARNDDVKIETVVVEGSNRIESLCQAVTTSDLVVLSSRRRHWWRRFFTDNASAYLRRSSTVPVLQVHGYEYPVDLTGNPIFRKILVVLDGSCRAEQVLKSVKSLGQLHNSTITLLNIQDNNWTKGSFEHTNPRGYLLALADQMAKQQLLVNARIMTTTRSFPAAIESFIEQEKIDLIALTTASKHSGWVNFRMDEAGAILRRTATPVLTVSVKQTPEMPEIMNVISQP